MRRQFFKDGAIYGVSSFLSSGLNILLVPIYVKSLPASEYGVVDYLSIIQIFVQLTFGLEITQGIARFYSASANEKDRQTLASTGLWFLLTSYFVFSIIAYFFAPIISPILLGPDVSIFIFRLAILSIFFRVIFYALQCQLRWELRAKRYAFSAVLSGGMSAILSFLFLRYFAFGIAGVFYALILGYAAGCTLCVFSLRKTYSVTFSRTHFVKLFQFSFPLVFSSLSLFVANYCDRLFVKQTLGFHELGIYGVAAKFSSVLAIAMSGFQLGAAPLIFREFEKDSTPPILAQLARLFIFAGIFCVLMLSIFARELLVILATPEYFSASEIIPLLATSILFANLSVFTPGLSLKNRTIKFALVNFVAGILTFILSFTLVPHFGILGAAIASVTSAAIGFSLHARASQKAYYIPFAWNRIALSFICMFFSIEAVNIFNIDEFFLRALTFLVVSFVILKILITKDEWKIISSIFLFRLRTNKDIHLKI